MTKRFYLDTEFTSFNGELLSLALLDDSGRSLYLVIPDEEIYALKDAGKIDPWVIDNVLPILYDIPEHIVPYERSVSHWGDLISEFLYGTDEDTPVQVIADWPEDITHLSKLLLTGPGRSVWMGKQTHFTVVRHIDVYPTSIEQAVQHNAWWDALAIRQCLLEAL